MRTLGFSSCATAIALMAGCTYAPNVDMTYAMPKARTVVTVTQTIGCSSANYILSVASPQIATNYVPDYDAPSGKINFQAPDNWFVDTDTAVTLTDDGRLASINSSNTGEAGAVVKSLITLVSTVARADTKPVANPKFCAQLAMFAASKAPANGQAQQQPAADAAHGAAQAAAHPVAPAPAPAVVPAPAPAPVPAPTPAPAKPDKQKKTPATPQADSPVVTITYSAQFDFEQTGDAIQAIDQFGIARELAIAAGGKEPPTATLAVLPDANSAPIVAALNQVLKDEALATRNLKLKDPLAFSLTVTPATNAPKQPTVAAGQSLSEDNIVKVPKLNVINFAMLGPVGDLSQIVQTSTSQAIIPTRDLIPIPLGKSEPFGKISTTLTAASSGLVTKLEYNKGSGAADLLTAANQVAGQALPQQQTAEQKATEIEGQSDLIYQQQRLILCQTKPAQCSSK